MVRVPSNELPWTTANSFREPGFLQTRNSYLDRSKMLVSPARSFTHGHGFAGHFQHAHHTYLTPRTEKRVPRPAQILFVPTMALMPVPSRKAVRTSAKIETLLPR